MGYSKEYYEKNKERILEKSRKYYAENKEKWKNKYYDSEVNTRLAREKNQRKRKKLISLLGGKCVRCGFDDWRALQVDHIKGGGSQDSKTMVGMKNNVLLKRIKNGSTKYQLLCANCNWIKRYEKNETNNKLI